MSIFCSAIKRASEDPVELPSKRKKFDYEPMNLTFPFNWNLAPIEIFILIFNQLWNILRSKKFVSNPLMRYQLVSKSWNTFLNDYQFLKATMNHPRFALALLKAAHKKSYQEYLALIMAAKDHLSLEDALKCLIQTRDPEAIALFGAIPAMAKKFRLIHYDSILGLASRRNYIFQHPKDIAHKPFDREDVLYHFSARNKRPLHDNLFHELFILLALEDCFQPGHYNSLHRYLNRAILSYWFEASKTDKQSSNVCLRHLRRFNLPKSHRNAMFTILEFSIFIAAYIGDLKFLKLIRLHWPSIKASCPSQSQIELLNVVEQLQSGTVSEFPVKKLESQIQLIEDGFLNNPFLFGFPRSLVDKKTKSVLDTADIDLSDNIKKALSQYLLSSA